MQAAILDRMGLGPEASSSHTWAASTATGGARSRFAAGFERLPEAARRRLVLENDDVRFGVIDTLWVHERTSIPLVFDNLHHRLNNPDGRTPREALAACLSTWPQGVRPKIHFSSPRTEWLIEEGVGGEEPRIRQTRWAYHADYVNPFEFIDFLRMSAGLPAFDVMLEVGPKIWR